MSFVRRRISLIKWNAFPKRDFFRSFVVNVFTGFRLKLSNHTVSCGTIWMSLGYSHSLDVDMSNSSDESTDSTY